MPFIFQLPSAFVDDSFSDLSDASSAPAAPKQVNACLFLCVPTYSYNCTYYTISLFDGTLKNTVMSIAFVINLDNLLL